ncbi:MAG TPA: HlyD family efflux transporter periplasmic adaptor subunit [Saprospiraceae bacterium]|mgnify:CR=1 FL=1|nr:HlyD family efflux transporter periplasmic adaptor subunit [Saprospiraceae bacterium]HMQ84196.1 HlyD family efflux transporter periplasmic adaptor subunit [Saprospiraceae bacterium]
MNKYLSAQPDRVTVIVFFSRLEALFKQALLWMAVFTFLMLQSCQEGKQATGLYGHFEAKEVVISAESPGKLLQLKISEGQPIEKGQLVALVDTTTFHLQRKQVQSTMNAIRTKTKSAKSQVDVLKEQRSNLDREKKRLEALLANQAATPKQLDDIEGQIEVLNSQIAATESQNQELNRGILAEIQPLEVQLEQLNEQIRRCYIHNPIDGQVLYQLKEANEMVAVGTPLYIIANMAELELRVYISGDQLPNIKIGQTANVRIAGAGELSGRVSWIAEKAEFTPKTVQNLDESETLVYAVKLSVPNANGQLKIGMPAEVFF